MGDLQKRLKQDHLDFENEMQGIVEVQKESEDRRLTILKLEQKIKDMELGNESLKMDFEKDIHELTQRLNHSERQSKIMEVCISLCVIGEMNMCKQIHTHVCEER